MGINYSHSKTGHGQDGQPEVGMSFGCTRLSQGTGPIYQLVSPHIFIPRVLTIQRGNVN